MSTPAFTVRSADDLVALAPVVLGFTPTESVMIQTFGASAGSFHARTDLVDDADAQAEVAAMLVDAAARNGARQVAVLVFSEHRDRALRQGVACADAFEEEGVDVLEVLRVTAERYHRIDDGADDLDGMPYDVANHPFTAEWVLEGRVVHASREDLAATLRSSDPGEVAEVSRLATRCRETLEAITCERWTAAQADARWLRGRIRRYLRTGVLPTAAEAARILVLCLDGQLRDVVWTDVERSDAARHVTLWTDLVRRAPDDLLPQAAGILALAAWVAGDGALAWCAIDRATEIGAETFLTKQVGEFLAAAVPPSIWRPMPSDELPILGP